MWRIWEVPNQRSSNILKKSNVSVQTRRGKYSGFKMGFKHYYHYTQKQSIRHSPTISPAIDDLGTGRLSPLIIPPVVVTQYIDCGKYHLRLF